MELFFISSLSKLSCNSNIFYIQVIDISQNNKFSLFWFMDSLKFILRLFSHSSTNSYNKFGMNNNASTLSSPPPPPLDDCHSHFIKIRPYK